MASPDAFSSTPVLENLIRDDRNATTPQWVERVSDAMVYQNLSYEQALWSAVIQHLLMSVEDQWEDVESDAPARVSVFVPPPPTFPPCGPSEVVQKWAGGNWEHRKAPPCQRANACQDPHCTFFHGLPCTFALGQNTDRRQYVNGQRNPRFGKAMECSKGPQHCPFSHASAELTATRQAEIRKRDRLVAARSVRLETEGDLFCAFPKLDWRCADYFSVEEMDDDDKELLLDMLGLPFQIMTPTSLWIDTPFRDCRLDPNVDVEPAVPARAPTLSVAAPAPAPAAEEDDDDGFVQVLANRPRRR